MKKLARITQVLGLAVALGAPSGWAEGSQDTFPFRLEHLFTFIGPLVNPPEVIGPVPEGIRANFYYGAGGTVTGPKLTGKVRAVGGDWFLMRSDGIGVIEVRTTFESHDGALIDVTYHGMLDAGPDGQQKFAQGKLEQFLPLHTSILFHTADPRYQWLNRLLCVGIGQADLSRMEVRYDIYAVRRP